MRIISGTVSGVSRLAKLQVELSRQARQRLKWFKEGEQRTALLSVFRLSNQETETRGKP